MNPENRTNIFAGLMDSAGYGISDELREALLQEFTNCAEVDADEGDNGSTATFLDALEYAANNMADNLE